MPLRAERRLVHARHRPQQLEPLLAAPAVVLVQRHRYLRCYSRAAAPVNRPVGGGRKRPSCYNRIFRTLIAMEQPTVSAYTIREARPEDFDPIISLWGQIDRHTALPDRREYLETFHPFSPALLLGAESRGRRGGG